MNTHRKLKATLWALAAFTFILIVWGGVVRRSGSGLGCPDWPLCYGQWIPPFDAAAVINQPHSGGEGEAPQALPAEGATLAPVIEFTHRFLAGVTGLLAVAVAVLILRQGEMRQRLWSNVTALMTLLVLQALLGGVTVKTELHGTVVAAHLALAFAFLGVVIALVRNVHGWSTTSDERRATAFWYVVAALFLQITLGGFVSGYQAGLACPDFPKCQGLWLPVLKGPVALQFVHRIGALIAGILTVIYGLRLSGRKRIVIIALVATQIALGIGNVMMNLAFTMDIAHLTVAAILFGTVINSPLPPHIIPPAPSYLRGGGGRNYLIGGARGSYEVKSG